MAVEVSSGKMVYSDTAFLDNSWIRVFESEQDDDEFVWHRDKKDRLVEVISGDGWKFQYDDNVPFKLERGMKLEIEAYSYHRIIKGNTSLVLRITEKNR